MAEGKTPRYGAYDPEADLLDEYGTLPLVPTFVDPTLMGISGRNPGFSIAAENPGTPVILPMDVGTNPHRELKGVRYERDYGDYSPTFEFNNPMSPNVPGGMTFSEGARSNPALMGAMLGGLTSAPTIPATLQRQRESAAMVGQAGKAHSRAQDQMLQAQLELENVRKGRTAGGSLGFSSRKPGNPSDEFYTSPTYISGKEARYPGNLPLGFGLRTPPDERFFRRDFGGRTRMSPTPYVPRSTREPGDYRFEEIVTRETPMMVPKPGREYTPNPYQSEASFRFGNGVGVPFPGDRTRSVPGYGKQYMQEGAIRGGYDDDLFEAYKAAEELGRLQRDRAAIQFSDALKNQRSITNTVVPGPVLSSMAGATVGEAYGETFGEGDTRYMDPTGEERMELRKRMPASAGREIRKVLQAREASMMPMMPPVEQTSMQPAMPVEQQVRMYQDLGQQLPAVGPLFAFDPYEGR